ncbi:MAG TPA: YraN family protein [Methylomirabilota bacterium]|nr:YraN family protein [Methylomirabilota bacterium]
MAIFSHVMFLLVNWAARRGLAPELPSSGLAAKQQAMQKGIRGETYAYWYLRRHGYVFVARNYTVPGLKGEIDLIGYDGPVLAFVEVKTRSTEATMPAMAGKPEDAVTHDKRRVLSRMARRFLVERRIPEAPCRFDVLAIEAAPGRRPTVRLHKDAFAGG